MTVEQSPLDHFGSQNQETQMILDTLKEITGVSDVVMLGQALEASKTAAGNYDLHHAVNILVDETSQKQRQQQRQELQQQQQQSIEHPLHGSPNPPLSQSPGPNNSGVIDLTNDSSEKEDDLQKAIALSLKEQQKVLGGQVSVEDQDISRVVEASLAESKAVGTKRKRGEVWQDPLNPHDRKRIDDWPVGLKNVGNTCWFSAVIQSLFHLPVFRQLVLNFCPQNSWNPEYPEAKEQRNLGFMRELRKLFALMLCSKRKYVDPSHALEELKEAFPDSSATDSQQDVSEFSHKLLEWLEEAFKLDSAQSDQQDDPMNSDQFESNGNPMLDLFYGHFRSEGSNEGHRFSNEEAFGQYPLQVNGFNDIHESLEAAMAQEIESYGDGMCKSGQESWFTRLPPVLLFELSRFQFNQQLGRPEKIHNKLEFPENIFMDRYMDYNKEVTRSKREQVRQLKEQRDKFQKRLEKYLNYGSGAKRVPLHDVLHYTLEFVESKKSSDSSPVPATSCSEDVEMASPCSSMGNDSPCDSPNKVVAEVILSTPFRSPIGPTSLVLPVNDRIPVHDVTVPAEMKPSPQHVSDVELRVLQSCLRRWRMEVETDVRELQDRINEIECTIKGIYSECSLQKEKYRLHGVLVHEGQAASGHYWAYVFSPGKGLWLKFNDITVTDASWAELQKESMGGHHYASAYCLVYVDTQRIDLFKETKESEATNPDCLEWLPTDLQKYVEHDNNLFLQEIEQWDLEQSRKKDTSTMTTLSSYNDIDCSVIAEKKMVVVEEYLPPPMVYDSLTLEHAGLVLKTTLSKVDQLAKQVMSHGGPFALEEALKHETSRLRRLARLPTPICEDARLQHVGVYILLNAEITDIFLNWSVLEQFSLPELADRPGGESIRKAAIQRLEALKQPLTEHHHKTYRTLHEEYDKFRRLVTIFLTGVENYYIEKYDVSLTHLIECCRLNKILISSQPVGKNKGLNPKVLAHFRRQSVLKLNEITARRFHEQSLKEAVDALSEAYEHVLPCIEFLISEEFEADMKAIEDIRNRWCGLLGDEQLETQKGEKLQDFLAKLLIDQPSTLQNQRRPSLVRIQALDEKYQSIMKLVISFKDYEEALQSK